MGRTALMFSGGGSMGQYHVGLIKNLLKNGVLPRVVSGSSAGSIICAILFTKNEQELKDVN